LRLLVQMLFINSECWRKRIALISLNLHVREKLLTLQTKDQW